MGYIEDNLVPGEEIIVKARVHWGVFVSPILLIILFCLLTLVSAAGDPESSSVCVGVSILFMLAAGLQAFGVFVNYATTEFGLTNQRIIAKTGVVRRHSLELMLSKVESVNVRQPIVGRILGYGTIVVTGSGGTKEAFPNIAKPMELRQKTAAQLLTTK